MKPTGVDCLQNQIKRLTAISRAVLIWATLTALIGLVRAELADWPALCRGTSTLGGETTHMHTSRTTLPFVWIIASVSCRHRGTRPHRLSKTRPLPSSLVLSTANSIYFYNSYFNYLRLSAAKTCKLSIILTEFKEKKKLFNGRRCPDWLWLIAIFKYYANELFDSAQKALFIPEGLFGFYSISLRGEGEGGPGKTYRKHNLWQTTKRLIID